MDIYRITHRDTGRCYIGSTIRTAASRYREHCRHAFTCGTVSPLYAAMREFGPNAFALEVIATAENYEELLWKEMQAISEHGCMFPAGFNLVRGGRGNYGWKPSAETKAKIAAKAVGRVAHNRGIPHTPETKERCRVSQNARFARENERGVVRVAWNKGIPASAETRKKLSDMRRGKPKSEAFRAAMKGRVFSAETRAKISLNKTLWWKGLSPDARAKHIASMSSGHNVTASGLQLSLDF